MEYQLKDKTLSKEKKTVSKDERCLHKSCTKCKGTGTTSRGEPCIHYISCKCKKCSPFYLNSFHTGSFNI